MLRKQTHHSIRSITRPPVSIHHPICDTPEWQSLSTNWNNMLNYYAAPGLMTQDRISVTIIIDTVSKYFDVTMQGLMGPSRMAKMVMARQIAQYLLRSELKMPVKAIGRLFHRDHTSVLYSIKYIDNQHSLKNPGDIVTHLINIENQLKW
jgi:chromosomal replication initiation ATPase DnaA